MRLIDADELIKTIMQLEEWNVPDFVYESIRNAPTVNVVRCKDCKWQITAYCPMPSWERKDNHYCYKGEREEDVDN